jgi:hypothetical protein
MAVERKALSAMDPNAAYGDGGRTVRDRLNQIVQQEAEFKQINRQVEAIFETMSDQDWISYKDRWLMFGEENAARWLVNKYGDR